jgi:hypothetical protein
LMLLWKESYRDITNIKYLSIKYQPRYHKISNINQDMLWFWFRINCKYDLDIWYLMISWLIFDTQIFDIGDFLVDIWYSDIWYWWYLGWYLILVISWYII